MQAISTPRDTGGAHASGSKSVPEPVRPPSLTCASAQRKPEGRDGWRCAGLFTGYAWLNTGHRVGPFRSHGWCRRSSPPGPCSEIDAPDHQPQRQSRQAPATRRHTPSCPERHPPARAAASVSTFSKPVIRHILPQRGHHFNRRWPAEAQDFAGWPVKELFWSMVSSPSDGSAVRLTVGKSASRRTDHVERRCYQQAVPSLMSRRGRRQEGARARMCRMITRPRLPATVVGHGHRHR